MTDGQDILLVLHNRIGEQGVADWRRSKFFRLFLRPLVILLFLSSAIGLAQRIQADPGSMVFPAAFLTVWIAVVVWVASVVVRGQAARTQGLDVLWRSGEASYMGPFDDVDHGLVGSGALARRHLHSHGLIVRLVLTPQSVEIVPTTGPMERLSCPLPSISQIDVTYGGRASGRLKVTRRDGRVAAFVLSTDESLTEALRRVGTTVSQR